jgi:hypothetical protein
MTAALNVFVFQCEDTELYALSLYRSGDNLPVDMCSGRWAYRTKLLMTEQSLATLPVDTVSVIAELQVDGYSLVRLSSKIILFPR